MFNFLKKLFSFEPRKQLPYRDVLSGKYLRVTMLWCLGDDPKGLRRGCDGICSDYESPVMTNAIPISEELTTEFRKWRGDVLEFKDDCVDSDNPDWSVLDTADWSALEQRGLELAQTLQRELPHFDVKYRSRETEHALAITSFVMWVSPEYCYADDDRGTGADGPVDGICADAGGFIPTRALPISDELSEKFHAWKMDVVKLRESTDSETADWSALDQRGLELAKALKRELPHEDVRYESSQDKVHIFEHH